MACLKKKRKEGMEREKLNDKIGLVQQIIKDKNFAPLIYFFLTAKHAIDAGKVILKRKLVYCRAG